MRRERCDCLVCYGFWLAVRMFLVGLAALLLLSLLVRAGAPKPLLIDAAPAAAEPAGTGDAALGQAPAEAPVRHSGVLRDTGADALAEVVPPERFRRDVGAVAFFSNATVAEACGGGRIACAGRNDKGVPIVVLPNPCGLAGRELYATIACHETGHVSGWPGDHGD